MAGVIEGDGAGVGVTGLGVELIGGRGMVLKPYCYAPRHLAYIFLSFLVCYVLI